MEPGAEIVQLYEADEEAEEAGQRTDWGTVALAGFMWSVKLAVAILAGMQLRELLG